MIVYLILTSKWLEYTLSFSNFLIVLLPNRTLHAFRASKCVQRRFFKLIKLVEALKSWKVRAGCEKEQKTFSSWPFSRSCSWWPRPRRTACAAPAPLSRTTSCPPRSPVTQTPELWWSHSSNSNQTKTMMPRIKKKKKRWKRVPSLLLFTCTFFNKEKIVSFWNMLC